MSRTSNDAIHRRLHHPCGGGAVRHEEDHQYEKHQSRKLHPTLAHLPLPRDVLSWLTQKDYQLGFLMCEEECLAAVLQYAGEYDPFVNAEGRLMFLRHEVAEAIAAFDMDQLGETRTSRSQKEKKDE